MDMTTTKLEPETERRLRERMESDLAHAKEASTQYMEVLKVVLGDRASDPLLMSVIDSYSTSKAKEILALRSLESCGWAK
jgi:hypothetical protein